MNLENVIQGWIRGLPLTESRKLASTTTLLAAE
jgi:hypothetical protein